MTLNPTLQEFVSKAQNQVAEILNLDASNTQLTQNLEAAQTQVATLQQQISAVQQQLDATSAGLAQATSDKNAALAQVAELTTELSKAQQLVTALQAQIAALHAPVVFDALECRQWLVGAGTVANSGSTGNTATSTQTLPGVASATRGLIPAGAYADKYWYLELGADPTRTRFRQEISFLFPSAADAANSQCVETDLQQVINGLVFNFGVQFDFTENALRVWDRSSGAWKPTGIAMPRIAAGTWVTCVWDLHRDGGNVYYDKLTLNGVTQAIQPTSFPVPNLGLTDMLNYGFQLDGEKVPNAYTVAVDRIRLTAWAN